ncbi:MAG TPA: protein phosphatase 2C domain-containing protein [Niabella sp.]|nr:protein phosphatase 2C domain-containing protein [Niabella sp.]HOZ95734.1 protein phosphatase 2C domain-containing protein [Niabella sp.]HQW15977.1 protein phosphatase 2C domain-containing protein [Niabella sp.]HQX21170.1 protein phosphatase 2C domain-containing protein [Niabella sp.]HQX40739.1 protein phosphatase 2C domain-containing protein [Niabella sp.]
MVVSNVQTDIGRQRNNNEDNYVWVENLWNRPEVLLIGAIDGVGGYDGGEEAAAIAKSTIENYLQQLSVGAPLQLLKDAIINANNQIHEKREEKNLNRMSCVLSVAILDAGKEMMYVGHVGDSRGYVYRNGELIKITKDHSTVGFKEDNGYLTEEEAMHHPLRNEISKMLGELYLDANDTDEYLDFTEHSFLPGDIVLFCSDGLTDLVNRRAIAEVLSQDIPVAQKVKQLIDKANDLGGRDNITVAIGSFSAKASIKKRALKKTIEIPIGDDDAQVNSSEKPTRKKKEWLWLLPVVFLVGFLANWVGTKKLIRLEKENLIDTIYVRDTIIINDSLTFKDSLIQATDTIFKDSVRRYNSTGY